MAPLEGVVVLDLGQIYNGPYCTLLLAHLGAEVIKVEPIEGESTRGRVQGRESYAYVMLGSSKKGICVNLKSEEGHRLFVDLARRADVVVENFAVGTMDRLGLSYDALNEVNPRIILASGKGFDTTGPLRDFLAMDLTVQAMTGIMAVTGFSDNPPVKAGAAVSDLMGGATLAAGVLAALYERERTGRGRHVEVAMQDALLPTLTSNFAGYFESRGTLPERTGNRHGGLAVAPYNVYECSDGWVAIFCVRERHWEALTAEMGRPELSSDERFSTMPGRARNMDEIDRLIGDWTRDQARDAVVGLMTRARIPCAPVRGLAELMDDPFLRDAGMLPEIDHPTMGPVRVFGSPIRFVGAQPPRPTPAPGLGQDTVEVLRDRLALSEQQIDDLRTRGVVG